MIPPNIRKSLQTQIRSYLTFNTSSTGIHKPGLTTTALPFFKGLTKLKRIDDSESEGLKTRMIHSLSNRNNPPKVPLDPPSFLYLEQPWFKVESKHPVFPPKFDRRRL